MYEKCPCEEDDQDQEITIFDEGESIEVTANPESFTPPDPNMILSVTNKTSANANYYLDKDTFVLDDVIYIIDDRHLIKPQIYLLPQHIKRMQLHDQSLAMTLHTLRKDKGCSTTLWNTYFLDDNGVLCWSVREEA